MSTEDLFTDIELDEASEEEAFVEYDIATYPSDYTIEGLQQMQERGDIVIPNYQRKFVWTIKQASLLVESFLLGLPVPPLFLYINEENKSEVIDGQQRLLSMMYYLEGFFGEQDDRGTRQVFKLIGLSERSPFKNKTFVQLDEKFQRKLRSSVLRAINIRQLNPHGDNTSVFHIFERLNTGGTSLKPQEIRNAVFRGEVVSKLQLLNVDSNWRTILGTKKLDRYQRDVELVLRLFALQENWREYQKPMKEFLNKTMKANRAFNSERAEQFLKAFPQATLKIVEALGDRPFRPKRVINAAVLEAVMVTVLETPKITIEQIRNGYKALINNEDFVKVIRGATTDTKMVVDRIVLAKNFLVK